jgi:hypothetical protein
MAAAAAIAAAAEQKDLGWLRVGKIAKKPKLGDPLQLFSLCEVLKSDGTGSDAKLTIKVIDSYWDKPMNFLPQGGGPKEGEELECLRKDLLPANPASQDKTADLADLDKCAYCADCPVTTHAWGNRHCLLTAACLCLGLAA